jgi:hypothetical protein
MSMSKLSKQQAEELQRYIQNFQQDCLLCGGPQAGTGLFIPTTDEGEALVTAGNPKALNRNRVILYALCEQCVADKSAEQTQRIEEAIGARMAQAPVYDLGVTPPVWPQELN